MKKHLSLVALTLFAIIISGCSTPRPAIDQVQAGKDIQFPGGYILHVAKREGSSVQGIYIHYPHANGPASEITAETGTIKLGIPDHSDSENQRMYKNQVTLILNNAKSVTGSTNVTFVKMVICLYKPI